MVVAYKYKMNEIADKDRLDFELLIERGTDGVIVTDNDGRIIFANRASEMIMGIKSSELPGKPFGYPVIAGETKEIEIVDGSGKSVVAEMQAADVEMDGRDLHLISLRDVTERKRVEAELLKSYREVQGRLDEIEGAGASLKEDLLRRLEKERAFSVNLLAAGIAGEISDPLSFISSNLGVLKKYLERITEFTRSQDEIITAMDASALLDEISEKRRMLRIDHILNDIHSLLSESVEGAERVKNIVSDLRLFSQPDEGEYEHNDINAALENTINIVSKELKDKPVILKEFKDIPATMCDIGRVNQAVINILTNAAEAVDKDGEIRVKTYVDEENIYISVADTGCGIPEKNLNRIFDPFFTTKDVGAGTGLGLSMARGAVERHNGEITVSSEAGSGSTFIVKIPIVEKSGREEMHRE